MNANPRSILVATLLAAFAGARQAPAQQCKATTTSLSSSVNPSAANQTVAFTAQVHVGGSPSGSVVFYDGGTQLKVSPLDETTLTATYTTPNLAIGTHTITARYDGDSYNIYCASASPPLAQVVSGSAQLSVSLCGQAFVKFGDPAGYQVVVSNYGAQAATNVTILFDPPPLNLSCSGVAVPFHQTCSLGTIAPGSQVSFDLSPGLIQGDYLQRVVVTSDQAGDATSFQSTTVKCSELPQFCPLLTPLGEEICNQRSEAVTCNPPLPAPPSAPGFAGGFLARLRLATSVLSTDIQAYYGLRDSVFSRTPAGRRYTQLYYRYGPEVTRHLLSDPALSSQLVDALQTWQGNVRALAEYHGSSAPITSAQIAALDGFINALKSRGSTELAAVLARERAALDLSSLVGRSMDDAWTKQQQTARSTITIPAAASVHGLNGTYFHSDVKLLNPSSTSGATATLRYRCFLGSCSPSPKLVYLQPRQMKALDDVVSTLFGAPETAGPIEVDGAVFVDSRVYTPSLPAPTTGSFVAGVTSDDALADSVLLALSHSVDRAKGFRTNAGVYNPSADALNVTFVLFDPTGHEIGRLARPVGGQAAIQVNDLFGSAGVATDVPDAYATVTADGIHELFAYATVIDNQSGDQVFVRGKNAFGVPDETWTLPAAASIHGANNSFFHSDVRVFNPSSVAAVNVSAVYRCFTGACSGQTVTFAVAPREMKVLDDIVAALFAAPGSAGPIELTGAVAVESRVYSPSKPAPTTGDAVPALRRDQAYVQSVLTSLSRSSDPASGFRTNAGFYNPEVLPITVTVSLRDPAGVVLGELVRDLPAHTAVQVNDVFAAAGVTADVKNAYAIVSGAGPASAIGLGRFFSYATVIDNASQDVTFVVGRPLDSAAPAGAARVTAVPWWGALLVLPLAGLAVRRAPASAPRRRRPVLK
jgi:uncharacterized repeat protein (TIGR01451 family)